MVCNGERELGNFTDGLIQYYSKLSFSELIKIILQPPKPKEPCQTKLLLEDTLGTFLLYSKSLLEGSTVEPSFFLYSMNEF